MSLKFNEIVSRFLGILVFFPFVGFVPNIDVQPTFFLLASMFLMLSLHTLKVKTVSFICVFIFFISIIIHLLIYSGTLDIKYTVTMIFIVATILLMVFLVFNNFVFVNEKTLIFVLTLYLFVGLVQFIAPDFMLSLVSRSEEAGIGLSETGRGIRSLASEPSAFGKIIITINVIMIYFYRNKGATFLLSLSLLLFLFNLLLPRSAYSILMHFVILFSLFLCINKKIAVLILFLALITVNILYHYKLFNDVRLFRLLYSIFDSPDYILAQGAVKRLFNIPMSMKNLFYCGWYGCGNNEINEYIQYNSFVGDFYYFLTNKVSGGFVEILLKMGVLSIPFYCVYLYMLACIAGRNAFCMSDGKLKLGWFFSFSIFVLTFQDSSPASPLSWFILLYFFFESKRFKSR